MSVTLKDVASRAGVNKSTVSRALNKPHLVCESTRRKILNVVRELNYRPAYFARVLSTKKTGNLGFIVKEDYFTMSEPFYTKILMGCERRAKADDYHIIVSTVKDDEKELITLIADRKIDGAIIAGEVNEKLILDIHKMEVPLVLVDYSLHKYKFPTVMPDNLQGAIDSVNYLVDMGHKDIGFIAGKFTHQSMKLRYYGFKMAMDRQNLFISNEFVDILSLEASIEDGKQALNRMSERQLPSAVIVANDALAIGVMEAAWEKGIRIPDDLSIIGFDNISWAERTTPPLTTVNVDKEKLGDIAVRQLIGGESFSTNEQIIIPVDLVIRETCKRI